MLLLDKFSCQNLITDGIERSDDIAFILFVFFPRIWCFLVLWGVARQNRPQFRTSLKMLLVISHRGWIVWLYFICFVNLVFI